MVLIASRNASCCCLHVSFCQRIYSTSYSKYRRTVNTFATIEQTFIYKPESNERVLMCIRPCLPTQSTLCSYKDKICTCSQVNSYLLLSTVFSWGAHRKLSLAIALVGNPSVLLLDEPTDGMDPVAKRNSWNLLDNCRSSGVTLLLATHR